VTAALDTLLDHALVGYGNVGYALRRQAWADDDPPAGALAGKVAIRGDRVRRRSPPRWRPCSGCREALVTGPRQATRRGVRGEPRRERSSSSAAG
jgi:hypothetical protein